MFPQVKQLRQADGGELRGKGGRRAKLNVSGHVGRSGIRKGEKEERGKGRQPREMSPSREKVLRPQFNLPGALKKEVERRAVARQGWRESEERLDERKERDRSGGTHEIGAYTTFSLNLPAISDGHISPITTSALLYLFKKKRTTFFAIAHGAIIQSVRGESADTKRGQYGLHRRPPSVEVLSA